MAAYWECRNFGLGTNFCRQAIPQKLNPQKPVAMKDYLQQLQWATLNHENLFPCKFVTTKIFTLLVAWSFAQLGRTIIKIVLFHFDLRCAMFWYTRGRKFAHKSKFCIGVHLAWILVGSRLDQPRQFRHPCYWKNYTYICNLTHVQNMHNICVICILHVLYYRFTAQVLHVYNGKYMPTNKHIHM